MVVTTIRKENEHRPEDLGQKVDGLNPSPGKSSFSQKN